MKTFKLFVKYLHTLSALFAQDCIEKPHKIWTREIYYFVYKTVSATAER